MINETFKNNLNSIGVELTDRQYEQFDMYYKLLVEWNSFMNLTGITDYEEVLLKHYVDSLVLDIEKIGHSSGVDYRRTWNSCDKNAKPQGGSRAYKKFGCVYSGTKCQYFR